MSIVVVYLAYLLISVGLTALVGHVLSRSGRLFLVDVLGGSDSAARGIATLMTVSFYLISLGFVALAMRMSGDSVTARQALQLLATKIGVLLLVLGALYLTGIVTLAKLRRRFKAQSPLDSTTAELGQTSNSTATASRLRQQALWRPAPRKTG